MAFEAKSEPNTLPEDARTYADTRFQICAPEIREGIEAERAALRQSAGPFGSPMARAFEVIEDTKKLSKALAQARLDTVVDSLRRFGHSVRPYRDLILNEVSAGVRAGGASAQAEIERVSLAVGGLPNTSGLLADVNRTEAEIIADAARRLRLAELEDGPPRAAGTSTSYDIAFMRLAVDEAAKCVPETGRTRPRVGAVVARGGVLLASAHRGELKRGEHAEYTVLEGKLETTPVAGATVYTTLEPCTSRNPPKMPCAERLIERKITRVVIGILDPNPEISGRGQRRLREANIVTEFFPSDLMAEIEELNRAFSAQFPSAGAARRPLETNAPSAAPAPLPPPPSLEPAEMRGLQSLLDQIARFEELMAGMRQRHEWDTPTMLTRLEALRPVASHAAPLLAQSTGIPEPTVREWIRDADYTDGPNEALVALRFVVKKTIDGLP